VHGCMRFNLNMYMYILFHAAAISFFEGSDKFADLSLNCVCDCPPSALSPSPPVEMTSRVHSTQRG